MLSNNVASSKAAEWAEQKKLAIERAKRLRHERQRGVMSENHTFRPETKGRYAPPSRQTQPPEFGGQKENNAGLDAMGPTSDPAMFPMRGLDEVKHEAPKQPTRKTSARSMDRLMRGESSVGTPKQTRVNHSPAQGPFPSARHPPSSAEQATRPPNEYQPQQRNATAGGTKYSRETQEEADEAFMALLRKDNQGRRRKSKSASRKPAWDDTFTDLDLDDRPPVHSQPKTYALGYKGSAHAPPTPASGYGGSGIPPPSEYPDTTAPEERIRTTASKPAVNGNHDINHVAPVVSQPHQRARPVDKPENQAINVDDFDLSRYIAGPKKGSSNTALPAYSTGEQTDVPTSGSRLSNRYLKSTQAEEFNFHEERRPPSSQYKKSQPPNVQHANNTRNGMVSGGNSNQFSVARGAPKENSPLKEPAPYRSIVYFSHTDNPSAQGRVHQDVQDADNASSRIARYGRRAGQPNTALGSRGSNRSNGSSHESQSSSRYRADSSGNGQHPGNLQDLAFGSGYNLDDFASPPKQDQPMANKVSRPAHREGRSSQRLNDREDHGKIENNDEEMKQNPEDVPLGTNHSQYDFPLDEAAEQAEPQDLRECPSCGRKFNPQAFEKHAKVCRKVFQTKRRKFDSSKVRIPGEAQQVQKGPGRRGTKQKAPDNSSKNNKWKAKSEELRQAMKAARAIKRAQDRGEDIRTVKLPEMPASSQHQSGMVPCPHCGRTFSENAAERHIPRCQSIQAKPSSLRKGSGRNAVSRR